MPRRHAPCLVVTLLLGTGCSLDRTGRFAPGAEAGPRTDAATGCAPGTVDVDGNAANGCECTITSPANEICDGVDNDCDPGAADGADDPRLLDPCDDADPDLCVDDVTLCEAGSVVCRPGPVAAVEVCNGLDDDCDAMVDEDATDAIAFTVDADGDGHGDPTGTVTMACEAPTGFANPSDDCDETNPNVYPGAPELCDTLDNDCNSMRDDRACPCDVVEHDGHVYLFCAGANWTSGRDACANFGYQLASVNTAAENAFLRVEADARSAGNEWIGFNDRSSEGSFVWQGAASSYTNWHSGEPSNGGCPLDIACHEDCVEMYGDGTWNDQACDDTRSYICEAP